MLKSLPSRVCAFDLEWVPDSRAGRLVYGIESTDAEVVAEMYVRGGANAENPRPFLKLALCRVVSVAFVERTAQGIALHAAPRGEDDPSEAAVIGRFLSYVGERQPCLVSFNGQDADLPILLQRAVIAGVSAPKFCKRPAKPWEGVDYFARGSDAHVDLKTALGSWGKATPSLHELAVQCGFPGKFGASGGDVAEMYAAGRIDEIVAYNMGDAVTTYLLWLRVAHFCGFFDAAKYAAEVDAVRALVESRPELAAYAEEWRRLQR